MEIPLPPPRLSRSYASFAGAEREVSEESRRLSAQVLTAYTALPFKGPVLELIPGVVAVEDMWEANLRDELMDRQETDTVASFSLEDWLKHKVETEGTADQRARLAALLSELPTPPAVVPFADQRVDDGFYSSGLPSDIMSVVHQPLIEVSQYRAVDDIPVDDVLGASQSTSSQDFNESVQEDAGAEESKDNEAPKDSSDA